jgi:hypothetical protein
METSVAYLLLVGASDGCADRFARLQSFWNRETISLHQ